MQWLEAQGSPSRECRLSEALGGHSEGQCTCEGQPKARCRWPGRVLDGRGNAHATTAYADVLSGDFDFHLLAAAVSSHGHGDGGLLPCSTTRCPMRMACALAGRRLCVHFAMRSACGRRAGSSPREQLSAERAIALVASVAVVVVTTVRRPAAAEFQCAAALSGPREAASPDLAGRRSRGGPREKVLTPECCELSGSSSSAFAQSAMTRGRSRQF